MRVFVTGATGFIGSEVVRQLKEAGHRVTGLARSDASIRALGAMGVDVHRGDLRDPESLRAGAEACEAVVHTAFDHDFAKYVENCELDRKVIAALGIALRGSDRPMLVTSGTVGGVRTEADRLPPGASKEVPRAASEEAADALAGEGVRVGVVRLPPSVHGRGDGGLIPMMIAQAKAKGASAYVGDGENRWSAAARADAAAVFVLGLQRVSPGVRYHGVAESDIPFRRIAETIGSSWACPLAGSRRTTLRRTSARWPGWRVWTSPRRASSRERPSAGLRPGRPCWTIWQTPTTSRRPGACARRRPYGG